LKNFDEKNFDEIFFDQKLLKSNNDSFTWCQNLLDEIRHNDTECNDIHHNDIEHNGTEHDNIHHNSRHKTFFKTTLICNRALLSALSAIKN
jgi:hypothetical protein